MNLRSIFLCKPCAARAPATSIVPRVVIDSHDRVTYSILGCPICGSHELHVESITPVETAPPAPTPPAPVVTPPAAEPPRALPAANENGSGPPKLNALPNPRAANEARPLAAPAIAENEQQAEELRKAGRTVDFIRLPTRVRCVDCEATIEFPVTEKMTDALARNGWTSTPRGSLCGNAHDRDARDAKELDATPVEASARRANAPVIS